MTQVSQRGSADRPNQTFFASQGKQKNLLQLCTTTLVCFKAAAHWKEKFSQPLFTPQWFRHSYCHQYSPTSSLVPTLKPAAWRLLHPLLCPASGCFSSHLTMKSWSVVWHHITFSRFYSLFRWANNCRLFYHRHVWICKLWKMFSL